MHHLRSTRRVRIARGPTRRAGMTLLEVVLAVALLAIVTVAAMSSISLIMRLSYEDRRIVGANEIAHKLLLQYLDEKKKMPPTTTPIDYAGGQFTFRYKLDETNMEMRTKPRESRGGGADLRTDRFRLVTVRVYDTVDTGGGPLAQGAELAVMSRMMDPIAITRNPDSMRRGLSSSEGLRDLLQSFTGGMTGGSTPAQALPRPSRRSRSSGSGSQSSASGSSR